MKKEEKSIDKLLINREITSFIDKKISFTDPKSCEIQLFENPEKTTQFPRDSSSKIEEFKEKRLFLHKSLDQLLEILLTNPLFLFFRQIPSFSLRNLSR